MCGRMPDRCATGSAGARCWGCSTHKGTRKDRATLTQALASFAVSLAVAALARLLRNGPKGARGRHPGAVGRLMPASCYEYEYKTGDAP